MAQLLEKLKAQQPRAIGLDLARHPPLEPGHRALVRVFESTPNLVGVEKRIGDRNNPAIPPSPVLSQLGQASSVDVVTNADSKLRRGTLFLTSEDSETIDSLGLRQVMAQEQR